MKLRINLLVETRFIASPYKQPIKQKMDKFQNKYRISTARVSWHDYDGGSYFITICTDKHLHYFGEIENGIMSLSASGHIAEEIFKNTSVYYPYAECPLFVVMPNHVHAIIYIYHTYYCEGRKKQKAYGNAMNMQSRGSIDARYSGDAMNRVSTGGVTSGKNPMISNNLATVVRGLKGRISHLIKQNTIPFKWQTRFYDHIIKCKTNLTMLPYTLRTMSHNGIWMS